MVDEIGSLEYDRKPTVTSIPSSRNLSSTVAKPPYFLYGNARRFLYPVHPEFVNTEMYSVLSRAKGYVHNLPIGMGFMPSVVDKAIKENGSEASPQELADLIFNPDAHKNRHLKRKIQPPSGSLERSRSKMPRTHRTDEPQLLKKPKAEFAEDTSRPVGQTRPEARKRNSSSTGRRMTAWQTMLVEIGRLEEKPTATSIPNDPISGTLSGTVAKPPYFLYGNATSLSQASWLSITQFLYSVHPEFVNTEMYSALSRTEGYVHNLDRFYVSPKVPLTIKEEAIPQIKKWWPAWDNRSQLTCINCETSGISHLCERLERASAPLPEQQRELIQQVQAKNLDHNKLGPLEQQA